MNRLEQFGDVIVISAFLSLPIGVGVYVMSTYQASKAQIRTAAALERIADGIKDFSAPPAHAAALGHARPEDMVDSPYCRNEAMIRADGDLMPDVCDRRLNALAR